jgi:hypothetical protein
VGGGWDWATEQARRARRREDSGGGESVRVIDLPGSGWTLPRLQVRLTRRSVTGIRTIMSTSVEYYGSTPYKRRRESIQMQMSEWNK